MKTLEKSECHFPTTLKEAIALLSDTATSGKLLAGGSDLMVQWESGIVPPEHIISLKGIKQLQQIEENEDAVLIGSGVTHAALRRHKLVHLYLPSLAAAAATVGGPQIQTLGTIGGSVANASPAGDLAPSLLITDGDVVVAGPAGERAVKLTSFFLGYRKIDLQPDEIIVRFELPKLHPHEQAFYRKLGTRAAQAISKVMGACRYTFHDNAIESFAVALGSVGPTPMRLPELESWIIGRTWSAEMLAEVERRASDEVAPIDDIRSTATYRKWVSGRLVRSFLEQ